MLCRIALALAAILLPLSMMIGCTVRVDDNRTPDVDVEVKPKPDVEVTPKP